MRSHQRVQIVVPDAVLAPLVGGAVKKDEKAWQQLLAVTYPGILAVAGRWDVTGQLSTSEDDGHNIFLAVVERLHAQSFRRLGLLQEVLAREVGAGWSWLATVARNTALNYTRYHAEQIGPSTPQGEIRFAKLTPFPDELADLLPESVRVIRNAAAHEIQAYAERNLPEDQLRALLMWIVGFDFPEIAGQLRLASAYKADLLVRAATNALRRRFNPGEPSADL